MSYHGEAFTRRALLGYIARNFIKISGTPFLRKFDRRSFQFRGKSYRYFHSLYNFTSTNERAVEIPIVWELVKGYPEESVLEVGSVLPHYFKVGHDAVDKFEKRSGVVNVDIVDYHPGKKYELIVSVSTLEHIGFDEGVKEPGKISLALSNVRSLLSPNGVAVFTSPLGYNPVLDRALSEGSVFDERFYLKRVSKNNGWEERSFDDVKGLRYGSPYLGANAIVVGFMKA